MNGALIAGIDNYPAAPLRGCVNDAMALANLLGANGDGSKNFHVELLKNVSTKAAMRAAIERFFKADLHTALFYFSGHGYINERGGFIVTPDLRNYDEGISMHEILNIVSKSKIKDKIMIFDCCHAGALGHVDILGEAAFLPEGVVILTSARQSEPAIEMNGHGKFTRLLLEALQGGAADLLGNITPYSIYAYLDRSLGFMEQRPQFKSNVNRFTTLRTVHPTILLHVLKRITVYFATPEAHFALDPSYNYSNTDLALVEHIVVFTDLSYMQRAGLVMPVGEEFMYWAAQRSKACRLTPLGMHYWKLVKDGRI